MYLRSVFLVLALIFTAFVPSTAQVQTAQKPCTPGVTFWTLLEGVGIGHRDGRLNLGKFYAVCLPNPSRKSTSNFPYDPDGGGKLSTIVKTADGKVVNSYVWYAEPIGGLWEMSRYKVLGGYEAVKPLTAGSYSLEFAADDKPFYRYPFTIVALKSDDPYEPAGNRFFIEGAWNEYGNIYYQRNDPQSPLTFTILVQDKAGHENKNTVPYDLKLINSGDGRLVASNTGSLRLQPRWLKAALFFLSAGAEKSYFKAGDLLKEDGRYSVRLSIDNKPYGEYRFVVKGGQIQLQGKQVRGNTEPMTAIVEYLSGGRYTSWWIQRNQATK